MAITTETPFQQWARMVKTRATGYLGEPNLGKCATILHRQIQKALGEEATPNLPTVRGWLDGACVPATPTIHTALMNALNLPETMEEAYPGEELTPKQKMHNSAAKARVTLTEIYDGLSDELKKPLAATEAPARPARAPRATSPNGERTPSNPHELRHTGYYDSPYIPERLITDGYRYQDRNEPWCKDAMKTTKNAHEYIACYIQAHGGSDIAAWGELHRLNAQHWYQGKTLPNKNALTILAPIMGEHYPAFEDLVITNRLAMAKGAIENNTDGWGKENDSAIRTKQQLLSEMPPRYWWAALEALHQPDAPATEKQPTWVQEIIPLKTQQDYLFAMRHALGQSAKDVAEALQIQPENATLLENGSNDIATPTGKKLVAFYTNEQQAIDRANAIKQASGQTTTPRLFDAAMFEKMPSSYDKEQRNAYYRTHYAKNKAAPAEGTTVGRG